MKRFLAVIFLAVLTLGLFLLGISIGASDTFIAGLSQWQESAELMGGQLYDRLSQTEPEGEFALSLADSGITGEGYTFDPVFYPYYSFLTDAEQALYAQAYANAMEMSTTFVPVVSVTPGSAVTVIEAMLYDHPELFWIDTEYQYRLYPDGTCAQITLVFNETAAFIDTARAVFDRNVEIILEGARAYSSDYNRERYVHDALISVLSYNLEAQMNQSSYSALVSGETVCAGYAKAFQYLMIQLGIPTYYCVGYSEGDHAWNIVKLEDGYYNVDLTWDDTSSSNRYFNRTDYDFQDTHTRTGLSRSLPDCSGVLYRTHS